MLINARKSSLLTQKQVAERAGTHQSAVAKYEAGTKTPSVDTLIRLLKANGFDLVLDVKKTHRIQTRSKLYKIQLVLPIFVSLDQLRAVKTMI